MVRSLCCVINENLNLTLKGVNNEKNADCSFGFFFEYNTYY